MVGNEFKSNRAGSTGGVFYVVDESKKEVIMKNNKFLDNIADKYGGIFHM